MPYPRPAPVPGFVDPLSDEARFRQEGINVKSFGGKGDGVTDDTVAIQNAINSGYPTIFFPFGEYITTAELVLPQNNVRFYGVNRMSSRVVNSTTNIFSSTNSNYTYEFDNLYIATTGANNGINITRTVSSSPRPRLQIYNCNFVGGTTGTGTPISLSYEREAQISNCLFTGTGNASSTFTSCFQLTGCINLSISGCRFVSDFGIAVNIVGNTTARAAGIRVSDCTAILGSVGVKTTGGVNDLRIADGMWDYCDQAFYLEDAQPLVIKNVYAASSATSGSLVEITSSGTPGVVPTANVDIGTSYFHAYNGITQLLNLQAGSGGLTDTNVHDNNFTDYGTYGILVSAGPGIDFKDNTFSTNTSVSGAMDINNNNGKISMKGNNFSSLPPKNAVGSSNLVVEGNKGLNPVGHLTSPTIPASGTPLVNPFSVKIRMFVSGGTVTDIAIGGVSTGLTSGVFELSFGESITFTYSAAPTIQCFGL